MKLFILFFIAFTVISLAVPPNTFACACCAEPGAYSIRSKKPEKFELDELKKIQFRPGAYLFFTGEATENIVGISPISDMYTLNVLFQDKTWKLKFRDGNGQVGMLNLISPTSMVSYMADIHDGRQGGAGGPLLYKEWRFKYKVQTGTGIFQKGIAPATEYFLVLQGRGNNCTQAEDFTNWRLEITGKKASYAFYGDLSSGKTAAN